MTDSPAPRSASGYVLGYTSLEHDRLIRQAQRLAPLTEGFFRGAGVGAGARVLDLGSGIGDVAMLAAAIVGPAGEVVGVERDPHSVDVARSRAAAAGLHNVSFLAADIAAVDECAPFDAVVGRFILQFVPDPVAALRSVAKLLRPNAVLALQEVAWPPVLAANAHLPLWSACAAIVYDAIRRNGANPDIGLALYRIVREAGFSQLELSVDMPLGVEPRSILWVYDLLLSVRSGLPAGEALRALGDLNTLPARLEAEARDVQSAVASIMVIGAAARRSGTV